MTNIKENFVVDGSGKRIGVFLPIKDYNRLLEEIEELADIKAYDKAMSRKQEFIPLEQALKNIQVSRKKKKS
jgi:hypothetical protein